MPLKNSWIFPAIESVHLIGVALLAGTIAIADYQLIARGVAVEVAARLRAWTRTGFVIMLTTGPLMFWTDTARYLHNPAFRFKMAALAAALIFHFTFRRKFGGRWRGLVSLALWTLVVLGGRGIADFDLQ